MPPVYNRAIGNVNLIVGRLLRACGCAPTGFKLRACRCAPAVGRREREVIVLPQGLKVSLRSGSEMGVKRRRSDFFDSRSGLARLLALLPNSEKCSRFHPSNKWPKRR